MMRCVADRFVGKLRCPPHDHSTRVQGRTTLLPDPTAHHATNQPGNHPLVLLIFFFCPGQPIQVQKFPHISNQGSRKPVDVEYLAYILASLVTIFMTTVRQHKIPHKPICQVQKHGELHIQECEASQCNLHFSGQIGPFVHNVDRKALQYGLRNSNFSDGRQAYYRQNKAKKKAFSGVIQVKRPCVESGYQEKLVNCSVYVCQKRTHFQKTLNLFWMPGGLWCLAFFDAML